MGDELLEFFRTIINDEDLSDEQCFRLFNISKNRLEREVKPLILHEEDATQTGTAGDIFTTMKTMPSNFRTFVKLYYGTKPLRQVMFSERRKFKDTPGVFYIDHKNSQFAQCGRVGKADSYYFVHIKKTTNFTEANRDTRVLTWPEDDFDMLIAYDAADVYQSNIDGDELSFRMSAGQEKEYKRLKNAFIEWDADLKIDAVDNRTGFEDEDGGVSLSDM